MRSCLLLALLCAVHLSSAQDYMPICDPSDYSDPSSVNPPLPDFPPQFSFSIEAVLGSRNFTIVATEYFDDVGNRGRFDARFNGTDFMTIYDYNLEEVYLIPDRRRGRECSVFDPVTSRFTNLTFGVQEINGTLHIGSPVRFIESISDDTRVRYIGESTIRGIPVVQWQACNSVPNNSYTVDYYFVPRSYNYNGESDNFDDDDDMVPVQFVLTASRLRDSGLTNYVHMYNFYNFKSGPESVPDDVFAVPNGLRCIGRSEGLPVPEIPKFFTLSAEFVSDYTPNRVTAFRETYDFNHKLLRIDTYYDGMQGGNPGPVSIVHDFGIGVEYSLNNNILGCQIQNLSESPFVRFDIDDDQGGAPQLVNPNRFFLRGSEFNYSYEGVTTVRGMEVDSWISVRDFEQFQTANGTNVLYEIFFTRPGITYISGFSQATDPVPVRFKISGTFTFMNRTDNTTSTNNGSQVIDVFDFSVSEPPYDSFDVATCYGADDYHFLLLAIPGHKEDLDYGLLRTNVRMVISNLTGLRPVQVGSIEVRGENSSHVFVGTRLYNLTSVATIDKATNVTADRAFDLIRNLTQNTTNSKLPVSLTLGPNLTVSPFLFHFGRGRNGSCNVTVPTANSTCPKNCTENFTTRFKLTDGVVAGIAIGLFFGGMLIGILAMLLCCCVIKCLRSGSTRNINPVKYKRHDDDDDVEVN